MINKKTQRRQRIHTSIRKRVTGTAERPRLSVFRSNTAIYAQLIDDTAGRTLVAASSKELNSKSANVETSKSVGEKLAEKAVATGVSKVVFDRGGYLYHGKIKALAEGARSGGLEF